MMTREGPQQVTRGKKVYLALHLTTLPVGSEISLVGVGYFSFISLGMGFNSRASSDFFIVCLRLSV